MTTMNQPSHPASDDHSAALRILGTIAMVLLIVGGLNWALVGLFDFDLVAALFGDMTVLSRIVYVLVGAAALYGFYLLGRLNKRNT